MPVRLLYIEDNAFMASLIERMLTPLGIEVITASSGVYGIQYAEKSKPDLILLNIELRFDEARKIMAILKSHTHLAAIPVIGLSEGSSEAEIGCDAYLSKPVRSTILIKLISDYMKTVM